MAHPTYPTTPASVEAITLDIPAKFASLLQPLHPEGAHHAAAAALRLYIDLGELGVKSLLARAEHENLTPAELIEHLLVQPIVNTDTAPATITPPKLLKRNHPSSLEVAERNAAIYAEYKAGGITQAKLADKYGLSMVRVAQILAAERARGE